MSEGSRSSRAALAETETAPPSRTLADGTRTPISEADARAWTGRGEPVLRKEETVDGPDPLVGEVLSGLYRVEGRIGEGGMGAVYTAKHVHLNKPFAIKVLADRVASSHDAVERLLQEAQAASSIEHENIVDVVSFDSTDDGRVYLVMELLKGSSLADIMDRGPMKLSRVVPIYAQLCDALGAAHTRGIVHRDLKPENIFIVRRADADFVKVLDFGISKVKSAEAEQVRVTRTGQLLGTPLYMSPEQAKGEAEVDHRSDIYSMGVMLYEMLVGRPPFEGSNYFQLLWKHGNEAPVPPREHNPDIPEALSRVILRALRKSPDERYGSTAELRSALEAATPDRAVPDGRLMSLPPDTPSPEPADAAELRVPTSRLPWILAPLATALVAGLVAFGMMSGDGSAASTETAPVVDAEPEPETTPEPETAPAERPPELEPAEAAAPETVEVAFRSRPSGATVYRDGEALGTAPFTSSLVLGAPLEVEYRWRGGRRRTKRFTVEAGLEVRGVAPRPPRADPGDNAIPSVRMSL